MLCPVPIAPSLPTYLRPCMPAFLRPSALLPACLSAYILPSLCPNIPPFLSPCLYLFFPASLTPHLPTSLYPSVPTFISHNLSLCSLFPPSIGLSIRPSHLLCIHPVVHILSALHIPDQTASSNSVSLPTCWILPDNTQKPGKRLEIRSRTHTKCIDAHMQDQTSQCPEIRKNLSGLMCDVLDSRGKILDLALQYSIMCTNPQNLKEVLRGLNNPFQMLCV